jgi:hypothetical protein
MARMKDNNGIVRAFLNNYKQKTITLAFFNAGIAKLGYKVRLGKYALQARLRDYDIDLV